MHKLVSQLSVRLIFKQLKVVTVESCTGGWIGKVLTDQAGSSQWFAGGLITYTNESKTRLANVSEDLLKRYGAVSIPVAEAMALGAHAHFDQCISVAVSGVAGPDGGTLEKPVGTVCVAVCLKGQLTSAQYMLNGSRDEVRSQTVNHAIKMLLDVIERNGK